MFVLIRAPETHQRIIVARKLSSVGVSRNYASTQPDAQTIAQLQDASQAAQRDALDGNKNNLELRGKSYEIDQLIDRMKSGEMTNRFCASANDKCISLIKTRRVRFFGPAALRIAARLIL